MFLIMFFNQSNLTRLWKTIKESQEGFPRVRNSRLDVVKYQIHILYIGLGIEEAHQHIWELPFLHYHGIMVIYHYPFLVVMTQLFSGIIYINDCICILTVSSG